MDPNYESRWVTRHMAHQEELFNIIERIKRSAALGIEFDSPFRMELEGLHYVIRGLNEGSVSVEIDKERNMANVENASVVSQSQLVHPTLSEERASYSLPLHHDTPYSNSRVEPAQISQTYQLSSHTVLQNEFNTTQVHPPEPSNERNFIQENNTSASASAMCLPRNRDFIQATGLPDFDIRERTESHQPAFSPPITRTLPITRNTQTSFLSNQQIPPAPNAQMSSTSVKNEYEGKTHFLDEAPQSLFDQYQHPSKSLPEMTAHTAEPVLNIGPTRANFPLQETAFDYSQDRSCRVEASICNNASFINSRPAASSQLTSYPSFQKTSSLNEGTQVTKSIVKPEPVLSQVASNSDEGLNRIDVKKELSDIKLDIMGAQITQGSQGPTADTIPAHERTESMLIATKTEQPPLSICAHVSSSPSRNTPEISLFPENERRIHDESIESLKNFRTTHHGDFTRSVSPTSEQYSSELSSLNSDVDIIRSSPVASSDSAPVQSPICVPINSSPQKSRSVTVFNPVPASSHTLSLVPTNLKSSFKMNANENSTSYKRVHFDVDEPINSENDSALPTNSAASLLQSNSWSIPPRIQRSEKFVSYTSLEPGQEDSAENQEADYILPTGPAPTVSRLNNHQVYSKREREECVESSSSEPNQRIFTIHQKAQSYANPNLATTTCIQNYSAPKPTPSSPKALYSAPYPDKSIAYTHNHQDPVPNCSSSNQALNGENGKQIALSYGCKWDSRSQANNGISDSQLPSHRPLHLGIPTLLPNTKKPKHNVHYPNHQDLSAFLNQPSTNKPVLGWRNGLNEGLERSDFTCSIPVRSNFMSGFPAGPNINFIVPSLPTVENGFLVNPHNVSTKRQKKQADRAKKKLNRLAFRKRIADPRKVAHSFRQDNVLSHISSSQFIHCYAAKNLSYTSEFNPLFDPESDADSSSPSSEESLGMFFNYNGSQEEVSTTQDSLAEKVVTFRSVSPYDPYAGFKLYLDGVARNQSNDISYFSTLPVVRAASLDDAFTKHWGYYHALSDASIPDDEIFKVYLDYFVSLAYLGFNHKGNLGYYSRRMADDRYIFKESANDNPMPYASVDRYLSWMNCAWIILRYVGPAFYLNSEDSLSFRQFVAIAESSSDLQSFLKANRYTDSFKHVDWNFNKLNQ